ncbi:hypothetical protein D8M09_11135 [Enterobacter sp. R1(2018)]|nr:hypothetical protein D8M09_11135 [Enterobacter sp. R1(2018)]
MITKCATTSNEYPEMSASSMRKIHASVINVNYTEYHLYKNCDVAQVMSPWKKKSCASRLRRRTQLFCRRMRN